MLYLDTSFLVPLFRSEPSSDAIEAFLRRRRNSLLCTSAWALVEFSSFLSREVRMGFLARDDARLIADQFDQVMDESFELIVPSASDYQIAQVFVRNFSTQLRAGDALHLATAQSNSVGHFYSLDKALLKAAKQLGVTASSGPVVLD
jgi:predicted nucleic acid-binding protein